MIEKANLKKKEKGTYISVPLAPRIVGILSANLKNAGFAIFLAATPSLLLWNSGLGLKLTSHSNWGELGPF